MRLEGRGIEAQRWLEKLADAEPENIELQKAAWPDGRDAFEPQSWHRLYFDAWRTLRFDRQYGAFGGELPISYMTIRAYAGDLGITGDDFHQFRTFFDMLDAEWLRQVKAKADAEAKGESNGR